MYSTQVAHGGQEYIRFLISYPFFQIPTKKELPKQPFLGVIPYLIFSRAFFSPVVLGLCDTDVIQTCICVNIVVFGIFFRIVIPGICRSLPVKLVDKVCDALNFFFAGA